MHNSGVNNNNFIFYFESRQELKTLGGDEYLNFINKKKFSYIILNSNFREEVLLFDKILINLKEINSINFIEKWIIKVFRDLIKKIKFWYIFFKKYNIILHEDNTPNNIHNIIKYIALKINNGNSFSIQRSYQCLLKVFSHLIIITIIFFVGEIIA